MPKARTTFFRQQERAKSSTFLLLFLFAGGVAGTILSVYLGIRLLIGASTKKEVLELFGAFPTSL
ncbi:MAG: hypothetical protein EBX52_09810, partial [Proteobacteria bacterium]|nr:hypothetical protein [Pseudomonadota bacterium]